VLRISSFIFVPPNPTLREGEPKGESPQSH
jgi:hypothetical protein